MGEKEEKWELPKKFRLSAKVLAAADEQQKLWAQELGSPFAALSPQARERGRAAQIATDAGVSPSERAEAYATLGRFDLAMRVPQIGKELFMLYAEYKIALSLGDDEWCNHPKEAQFVERDVYSIRHKTDAHLLRCNICGFRNLVPVLPEHIAEGRRQRQESRRAAKGMTPLQAKQLLGGRRG